MQIKILKYILFTLIPLTSFLCSCTDEEITPTPSGATETDPNIPQEILNGYSVSFNFDLGPMGGSSNDLTRAELVTTNPYLREIENFIDLEKIRILFFVCIPDENNPEPEYNAENPAAFKKHRTTDYFLFESKSRWVSQLSDDQSTQASYQVTAPVFTYGNNDEYDWESVRYALENYNFKIAILANRPDYVNFGDFDSKFGGKIVEFTTDRGPNWGPEDGWKKPERLGTKKDGTRETNEEKPTINGLHHCQWDAVYSSKNNGYNDAHDGSGVYSFIMGNPKPTENKPLKIPEGVGDTNMMGALSYWTEKKPDGKGGYVKDYFDATKDANYYIHPSKIKGIPMYGVQKFVKIGTAWSPGSPFNVSNQSGYTGDNIHLLRSVVKLELKIPRRMTINNRSVKIEITHPHLQYSNVMARCEPLDVETPTELIWSDDENGCEWQYLYKYGPIINGLKNSPTAKDFSDRMAWFYRAWEDWWNFSDKYQKGDAVFTDASSAKGIGSDQFPHIYNPVIQRNGNACIEDCQLTEDQTYWYYVVYTGERNINDPSKFDKFDPSTAEVAFFTFFASIDGGSPVQYVVALTDYTKNTLLTDMKKPGVKNMKDYLSPMATNLVQDNWNWPLLRNHVYTFTVTKFGNYADHAGIDVKVVSTENRTAPTLIYE
ncbi:MAG: hypothetical protein J1F12_04960 [Muribaculaceae bacterium]|nr:hypothetical protein [Muribaculaceae bacterium]